MHVLLGWKRLIPQGGGTIHDEKAEDNTGCRTSGSDFGGTSDPCEYSLDFDIASRFHEIVSCVDSIDSPLLISPVRHHDSFEAPFVTEKGREKFTVLLCVLAIHLVIRRHYSPRVGIFDSNLKVLEINLTQGSLADTGIYFIPVGLQYNPIFRS